MITSYIKKEFAQVLSAAVNNGNVDITTTVDLRNKSILIDKVRIGTYGDIVLFTDYTCDKAYMDAWRSDVGGVLLKDLKKKKDDLYSEFSVRETTNGSEVAFTALVRMVTDDVKDMIDKSKQFYTVKVGDYDYLIIKVIPLGSGVYNAEYQFTNCVLQKEWEELPDSEVTSGYSGDDTDSDEPLYIDESLETTYNFFGSDDDD